MFQEIDNAVGGNITRTMTTVEARFVDVGERNATCTHGTVARVCCPVV